MADGDFVTGKPGGSTLVHRLGLIALIVLGLTAAFVVPAAGQEDTPDEEKGSNEDNGSDEEVGSFSDPDEKGSFSDPFVEPKVHGERTKEKCVADEPPRKGVHKGAPASGPPSYVGSLFDEDPSRGPRPIEEGEYVYCKPAAGSVSVLPSGNVFYWNSLEATENVRYAIGAEYGSRSVDDQSRYMELDYKEPDDSKWRHPDPVDGGADPRGNEDKQFVPPGEEDDAEFRKLDPIYNDGALFCADHNFLTDGKVLAVGGTTYKNDPPSEDDDPNEETTPPPPGTGTGEGSPGGPAAGSTELEGVKNTRS